MHKDRGVKTQEKTNAPTETLPFPLEHRTTSAPHSF